MRFEAKHQTFKKFPKVTKHFKNLPKTLAGRHQSGIRADSIPLAGDDASDHPMFRRDFTVGCGSTSGVLDGRDREDVAAYIARFYPTFGELSDEAIILQVGSVTMVPATKQI